MKRRKTVTLAQLPTDERMKKADAEDHDQGSGDRRITIVNQLERYWRRGVLEDKKDPDRAGKRYAAGMEYRATVHLCGFAGVSSSGDMSKVWGTGINWDGLAKTEGAVAARKKHRKVVQGLGPILSTVVDCVVIYDHTLEQVGYRLGVEGQREAICVGKFTLTRGLDCLVDILKA